MADRSGWAHGFWREGSEWLAIAGSAHQRPVLYPSREAAEDALAATALPSWKRAAGEQLVAAYVTERRHDGVSGTGMAYWIDAALNPHLAPPPQGQADEAGHPTGHTREQARVRAEATGAEGVLHAHDPNRPGRCSVLLDGSDALSSYGYPELTVLARSPDGAAEAEAGPRPQAPRSGPAARAAAVVPAEAAYDAVAARPSRPASAPWKPPAKPTAPRPPGTVFTAVELE